MAHIWVGVHAIYNQHQN